MTYATQQDMTDRFGESDLVRLTDRAEPPLDAVDATVLLRAQEDAKAMIDSYLTARYTLPLSPVPLVLKRCECDLAYVQLLGARVGDEWAKRQAYWLGWLKDVSKGTAQLGVDASNNAPATEVGVYVDADAPVFSRDTLADYA